MIKFIEENRIEFDKESITESLKCHHKDIKNYITDKLIDKSKNDEFCDFINSTITGFYYFKLIFYFF